MFRAVPISTFHVSASFSVGFLYAGGVLWFWTRVRVRRVLSQVVYSGTKLFP